MLIDINTMFSDGQAVTATAASTKSLNLGEDIGHGNLMALVIAVSEVFAGLTSLQVVIQHSDDDSTWEDVLTTAAVPVADLVAGYRFMLDKIPYNTKPYVRLRYVVAGTGTGGKISAYVTPTLQEWYGHNQKLGGER
ncbi:Bbp16 family capsid cement protein [Marinobacterium jannaschii]|uniref:Bbp16 family capsid cement protein n=1 Tax=Marinobacterium jannaschii TaxID=64970 RepID=UPI0006852069|nr:hypothetical protein [Marinobacterium jannaschii]